MRDLKLYIATQFSGEDNGDGGIRRIVEAQRHYLPKMGIKVVPTMQEADLICSHAGDVLDCPIDKPWVVHCQGLYWADNEWADWSYKLNRLVIEAMRRADHVTTGSEWVSYILKRGMWLRPTVLKYGIDPNLWSTGENGGYVLWNKTRVDPVCDPAPLNALAKRLPKVNFTSTFADKAPNVTITGKMKFREAQELIRNAGVYLATTRETMGIGTLEAMACGVPILGYKWGGQAEFIEHKETGWLAEVGDVDGLVEGYNWLMLNREKVGSAARKDCLDNWTWDKAMQTFVDCYRSVYEKASKLRPKVSVIMPCYNLVRYLPDAIKSVQQQTMKDWELVIVDDHSPDDTFAVASDFARTDKRIRVMRNETNLYLAGALNAGISESRGRYILPLDADNMIAFNTLGVLSEALKDRRFGISYGGIQFVKEDGKPDDSISPDGISSWPPTFSFEQQMKHRNQIPSTCMYRREMWERTGGYRSRYKTAEDASFWTQATSYGFRPVKCTAAVTLIYRNRHDSMSRVNTETDWTSWVPWAKKPELTPFGAATEFSGNDPSVPTYEPAKVTVVIPVGPGHEKIVIDALDSVESQTFRLWDCIVVNDTGENLDIPHPWAKIINTEGRQGVASARNIGIVESKTECFVLLDADDILQPNALHEFYSKYQECHTEIYSQWWDDKGNSHAEVYDPPEWDPPYLIQKGCMFAVTGLYLKSSWEKVGGFDTTLKHWEDWDYQIALANAGIGCTKVHKPLWTYRKTLGYRRDSDLSNYNDGKKQMTTKWKEYWEGGKQFMACGGCGGRRINTSPVVQSNVRREGTVMVEYIGPQETIHLKSHSGAFPSGKANYKFGQDSGHKRRWVWAVDLPELLRMDIAGRPMIKVVETEKVERPLEPVLRGASA